MSKRVVTLGEIMLRLSTPHHKRILQSESFDVHYGGGEANVAIAVCNYGLQGVFVSKLPDNAIGQSAINHMRKFGVDTSGIIRGGDRMGVYYVESGASIRSSQVIYDRKDSSFAKATAHEFDFEKILEGAGWLHVSGITPAISQEAANMTEQALKIARSNGITTSFDLNIRKKMWTSEQAAPVISSMWKYVDVVIGMEKDFYAALGHPLGDFDYAGKSNLSTFENTIKDLQGRFGCKYFASTLRMNQSASYNELAGFISDGKQFHLTKKYDIHIVDRVGSGDSFASGLIYGLMAGKSMQDAAEFGVAASALKHTFPGDTNYATIQEIENLIHTGVGANVQR
jgi:2-dehydro-3-deoxygluconokinase